ncbi:MAG: TetR family transcriptional regulator [Verrucomicrobiota bacterium]
MKRTLAPTEGPKLRLVEAAEKLFAENGFDVVSVRDITQEAGANVAAVNYHFGSRDGLVAVVMTRYLTPINEERLAQLEAAEERNGSQAVPLEEVVAAFVLPLISQVAHSNLSCPLLHQLVGRIFSSSNHALPPEFKGESSVLINRFIQSFSRALPTTSRDDLVWRLHFVLGALTHMLMHGQAMQSLSQGPDDKSDMAATMGRFLSFAVAGLRDGSGPLPAAQTLPNDDARDEHRAQPQAAAEQEPDDSLEPSPQAASQEPDDSHEPPPQAAAEQEPDDSHEPPPQAASAQELDDSHEPPPQAADEQQPKRMKRRSKKSDDDSPQVMFDF